MLNSLILIFFFSLLTVKPLEFVSSNVDIANAAFLVDFNVSNDGGLMYTIYGFISDVRNIFNAFKN